MSESKFSFFAASDETAEGLAKNIRPLMDDLVDSSTEITDTEKHLLNLLKTEEKTELDGCNVYEVEVIVRPIGRVALEWKVEKW